VRAPLTWLAEYVDLAPGATGPDVAASLVAVGLEEEDLHGGDITGPLVVGRVLSCVDEPQKNGKTIRWCTVDVGPHGQMATEGKHQEIVCGAHNFEVGDLVVVVLPGAVLPGGFAIAARTTYGHVSNGMICAEDELGIGEDHTGIIVLQRYLGAEVAAALTPGDDAIALLGLGEEVLEVNVTPDRGYCFSLRGIAREYWHATGSPVDAYRDPGLRATPPPTGGGFPVRLDDATPIASVPGCDRYVARMVRGIDPNAPSPRWMQRRLTQMGMRPISLAVDVTNYVMLALGQPLHAFDADSLRGPIVVRRARPGERLTTLDDVDRPLDPEDLLITDAGELPLAIAGVMGGATSEVTATTTTVLIEAAHFDPVTIARSSRRHKLITEASKRFERGVDPLVTAAAADLAVELLVTYGGGVADAGVTDAGIDGDFEPAPRASYELALDEPGRIVGVSYPRDQVVRTLTDLGCTVEGHEGDADVVTVTPPSWRPDLVDGPDYAEEVARIAGYDTIPSVLPTPTGTGTGLTHGQRVRRLLADTLAARGYVEVLTYPFTGLTSADDLGLATDDERRHAVRLANPLSDEAPFMRTSVLATLVDALRRNVSRGQRDLALMELGLVTLPGEGVRRAPLPSVASRPGDAEVAGLLSAVPPQPRHVALLATGSVAPRGWWGEGRPVAWSDLVESALAAGRALGLDLEVGPVDLAPWHPGRCARLTLADGTTVGYAGELHPAVLQRLGLPARCCAAELDVDVLTAASAGSPQATPFSTHPAALSDIALVVDASVPAAAVETAVREGAGPQLEVVSLFDVYVGDQVGPGRKSLAYRLTFRAPDRTLTTEEVNGFRDAAVARAAERVGAVQR